MTSYRAQMIRAGVGAALGAGTLVTVSLLLTPQGTPWVSAWTVTRDSDVMAVVAVAASVLAWALVGTARRRAISPRMAWRTCAAVGSMDEVLARRSLGASPPSASRATDPPGRVAPPTGGSTTSVAGWLTAAVVVLLLSMAAVGLLAVVGHFPVDGVATAPVALFVASLIAGAGVFGALLIRNQLREQSSLDGLRVVLVRRGPHSLVVAGAGEIALGLIPVIVAAVLTHTFGSAAPSIPEVVAVAMLARLVTLTPLPALGLGWADSVMLIGLAAVNVPIGAAIATTVVWRVTQFAAIALGWLTARRLRWPVTQSDVESPAPTDSRIGHLVHRGGFALLALLPDRWRLAIRRRIFDGMFSVADDPWDYEHMPYERRKQASLAASVPSDPRVILEVGCADGHNLAVLAHAHPRSLVIGTDVSGRAVARARDRVRQHANARVVVADFRDLAQALGDVSGQVDVLVLSEVLYYLGVAHQVDHALQPARALLHPAATVILVHGASDAMRLHDRACRALGATASDNTLIDDPDRPYMVTTAVLRLDARPGAR